MGPSYTGNVSANVISEGVVGWVLQQRRGRVPLQDLQNLGKEATQLLHFWLGKVTEQPRATWEHMPLTLLRSTPGEAHINDVRHLCVRASTLHHHVVCLDFQVNESLNVIRNILRISLSIRFTRYSLFSVKSKN